LQKVPFIAIIGNKEQQNNSLSIRSLGSQQQQSISIDDFIAELKKLTIHSTISNN
jgi:threonyl-tRNA synthetase